MDVTTDPVACAALWPILLPLIPVTIGIIPIVLPIEGIKRLLPDKVIKVAP